MYYGIKDGMISCKSNKIINLHNDIEFHIESDEQWASGDFYDYDTEQFSINPDSINRKIDDTPTELEIIQERLDDPMKNHVENFGYNLEDIVAGLVDIDFNPPDLPRLDNIEAKINEIVQWVNSQGGNIDELDLP